MAETPAETKPPEGSPPATPPKEPATPPVDLVEEAARAARETTPPKVEIDSGSLNDVGLSDAQLAAVKAHTSRAVNDAVTKSTSKAEERLKGKGYISQDQLKDELDARDADHKRSSEAKDRYLSVLSEEGHAPGSAGFKKVSETYKKLLDDGQITPQVLLNKAGIRSLVMMAGMAKASTDGGDPQGGLDFSTPAGEMDEYADGTVALGGEKSDKPTLEQLTRSNMAAAVRNQ